MEIDIKKNLNERIGIENMGFCLWKVSELIQHFIWQMRLRHVVIQIQV